MDGFGGGFEAGAWVRVRVGTVVGTTGAVVCSGVGALVGTGVGLCVGAPVSVGWGALVLGTTALGKTKGVGELVSVGAALPIPARGGKPRFGCPCSAASMNAFQISAGTVPP